MTDAQIMDTMARVYFSANRPYDFVEVVQGNDAMSRLVPQINDYIQENYDQMLQDTPNHTVTLDTTHELDGVKVVEFAQKVNPSCSSLLKDFKVVVRPGGVFLGEEYGGGGGGYLFPQNVHTPCEFSIVDENAYVCVYPRVFAKITTTVKDPRPFQLASIYVLRENRHDLLCGPMSLDKIRIELEIPFMKPNIIDSQNIEKVETSTDDEARAALSRIFVQCKKVGMGFAGHFSLNRGWKGLPLRRTISLRLKQAIKGSVIREAFGIGFSPTSDGIYRYTDEVSLKPRPGYSTMHGTITTTFYNSHRDFLHFEMQCMYGLDKIEVMDYSEDHMREINELPTRDLITLEDQTVGEALHDDNVIFVDGQRTLVVPRNHAESLVTEVVLYACKADNNVMGPDNVVTDSTYINLRKFGLAGDIYVTEENMKEALNHLGRPVFEIGVESCKQLAAVISKRVFDNPGEDISSAVHCQPGYAGPVRRIRAYQ